MEKWDLQQRPPPQPQSPSVHSKCWEIIKLWILRDFVNISPHIFFTLPRKHPFCIKSVLLGKMQRVGITKQPSANKPTHPPPTIPSLAARNALVLTLQGQDGRRARCRHWPSHIQAVAPAAGRYWGPGSAARQRAEAPLPAGSSFVRRTQVILSEAWQESRPWHWRAKAASAGSSAPQEGLRYRSLCCRKVQACFFCAKRSLFAHALTADLL